MRSSNDTPETKEIGPEGIIARFPKAFVEKMQTGKEVNISFICTGNFNRSPALHAMTLAAVKKNQESLGKVRITSAGTRFWEGSGKPVSPFLIEALDAQERAWAMALNSHHLQKPHIENQRDLFFTVSEEHRDFLTRFGIDPSKIIALPEAIHGKGAEEIYDPQSWVRRAMLSFGNPQLEQTAMAATGTMVNQIRQIVEQAIIPALLSVASRNNPQPASDNIEAARTVFRNRTFGK